MAVYTPQITKGFYNMVQKMSIVAVVWSLAGLFASMSVASGQQLLFTNGSGNARDLPLALNCGFELSTSTGTGGITYANVADHFTTPRNSTITTVEFSIFRNGPNPISSIGWTFEAAPLIGGSSAIASGVSAVTTLSSTSIANGWTLDQDSMDVGTVEASHGYLQLGGAPFDYSEKFWDVDAAEANSWSTVGSTIYPLPSEAFSLYGIMNRSGKGSRHQ